MRLGNRLPDAFYAIRGRILVSYCRSELFTYSSVILYNATNRVLSTL